MTVRINILFRLIFRYLLTTLLIFVSPVAVSQTRGLDLQSLDQGISRALAEAGIPGCSVAVTDAGETIFLKTYGVRHIDSMAPIDHNTVFEAASLTKPVVAYCAMKLVEQKDLDLDRPLYTYLEYPDASHDDRYKSITPRLVLSHMSGFPNWRSESNGDTLNLSFDPGSEFGYSGEGFVYLQKVMEKVTGTDLNAIASRFVFQPLEMGRSSLVFADDENYAVGHDTIPSPKKKSQPAAPNAAYSLHTTAGDYAKFMNELVEPHFISRTLRDQMLSTQSFMDEKGTGLAWGLGVGLNRVGDKRYVWHWGDNGTFRAFFIVSAESGLGFVYFANSQNGLRIVNRMIHLVFSNPEIMRPWNMYDQLR